MGSGDVGANILGLLFILVVKVAPVVLGLGAAIWLLPRTGVGRSLLGRARDGDDQGERLLLLESEVARLREELAEVQERQDFTERLIAPDRPLPMRSGSGARTPTPPEVTPVGS